MFQDDITEFDRLFLELSELREGARQSRLSTIREQTPELATRLESLLHTDARIQEEQFLASADSIICHRIDWTEAQTAGGTCAEARASDPMIGTRVGDFRVTSFLAEGGMGRVYKAQRDSETQPQVDQLAAVKILTHFMDGNARRRFEAECQIMGRLSHPGIVPLLQTGITKDVKPYFAMPLIDGTRIDTFCKNNALTFVEIVELTLQTCNAVRHAHDRGILHRDLKPSNILVTEERRVLVTDFGLGKILRDTPEADSKVDPTTHSLTGSREILGTPAFIPPELLNAGKNLVTVQSDVFGIGATLYALLAGQAPHSAPTVAESLIKAKNDRPPPVRQIVPSIPRDLDTICSKCLEKDPEKRYASVAELAQDLERFQHGMPVVARPVSTLVHIGRWMLRNRLASALVLMLITAIGGSIMGLGMLWQTAEKRRAGEAKERQRSRKIVSEFFDSMSSALARFPDGSEDRRQMQRRMVSILQDFVAEAPTDEASRRDYAIALYKLACTERELGNDDSALEAQNAATQMFDRLAQDNPKNLDYLFDLAHMSLAGNRLEEAYDYMQILRRSGRASKFHEDAFATICAALAVEMLNDPTTAEAALEIALEGEHAAQGNRDKIDDRKIENPVDFLKPLGANLQAQAIAYWRLGDTDNSVRCIEDSIEIADRLRTRNPGRAEFLPYSVVWRNRYASLLLELARLQQAESVASRSHTLAHEAWSQHPHRNPLTVAFFRASAMHAETLLALGNDKGFGASEAHALMALEHDMRNLQTNWPNASFTLWFAIYGSRSSHSQEEPLSQLLATIRNQITGDAETMHLRSIRAWYDEDYEACIDFLKQSATPSFTEADVVIRYAIYADSLLKLGEIETAREYLGFAFDSLTKVPLFDQAVPKLRLARFLDEIERSLTVD